MFFVEDEDERWICDPVFASIAPIFIQAGRVPEPTTCAVVIPCFNEGASIAPLVAAARRHSPGCSSWTTVRRTTRRPGLNRRAHRWSRTQKISAKAPALRTGLSQARQQGFEWAFTLDGDGQHAPDDMPAFLECAGQTGASLVVGNRMPNARAIPWLRRQVNRWMSASSPGARAVPCPTRNAVSGSSTWQPGQPCRSRRNILKWNPKH